ncbi:hypothetical protein JCM8547_005426 [Rhodosporidiobolus lusitaniae]
MQQSSSSPTISSSSATPSPVFSSPSLLSSPLTSNSSTGSDKPSSSASRSYYISESPGRQVGAFAGRPLLRGECILQENPLFTVTSPSCLPGALSDLPDASRHRYYLLSNAYAHETDLSVEEGIFHTNAFSLSSETRLTSSLSSSSLFGIFPDTARINHSCRPNVKASFDPASSRMRVHVLRPISPDEELFTAYLGRSDLYGLDTSARQARLKKSWAFECSCPLCSASIDERRTSDHRRNELAALKARLPGLRPRDVECTLRECARALDVLEEEGVFLDGDEFASAAAKACSWHRDEEAAGMWARIALQSARSEYGASSELALRLEKATSRPYELLPGGTTGGRKRLERLTREVLGKRLPPHPPSSTWSTLANTFKQAFRGG